MTRTATRGGATVFFFCLAFAYTSQAGIITDNFDDNSLNPSL